MYALRRTSAAALRSSTKTTTTTTHGARAFSLSAPCQRGLPVFVAPSSPELAQQLADFNAKILLPSHLSKEQQRLVYSRAGQAKLAAEPVNVTVGDVVLPLEPLDRLELPRRFNMLRALINASRTRADWENVIRALEGFESAGIPVRGQWQELVARRLAQNDMHSLLLKALQRPKATTMRLSNPGLLRAVLRAVHDKAALAAWSQEETAAALRLATQIVELMEDEEHHAVPSRGTGIPHQDLRRRPATIALPTELAAVAAERHGADTASVKTLAARLVASLEQTKFTGDIARIAQTNKATEADYKSKTSQVEAVLAHCHELFELLIVWNALATSRRVLARDMPRAAVAATTEAQLEAVLADGIKAAERLVIRAGKNLGIWYPEHLKDSFQACQPAAK